MKERFEIVLDPLGHYKNADPARLLEACGLLPHFALEQAEVGDQHDELRRFFRRQVSEPDLEKRVLKRYAMAGSPMGGFWRPEERSVKTRFGAYMVPVLQYPGDPPMHPYLLLAEGSAPLQAMVVYPSGWTLFMPHYRVYRLD